MEDFGPARAAPLLQSRFSDASFQRRAKPKAGAEQTQPPDLGMARGVKTARYPPMLEPNRETDSPAARASMTRNWPVMESARNRPRRDRDLGRALRPAPAHPGNSAPFWSRGWKRIRADRVCDSLRRGRGRGVAIGSEFQLRFGSKSLERSYEDVLAGQFAVDQCR